MRKLIDIIFVFGCLIAMVIGLYTTAISAADGAKIVALLFGVGTSILIVIVWEYIDLS